MRACAQARFQGSGPGGQKRNRVYSGVRLTHEESRLTAESVDSRVVGNDGEVLRACTLNGGDEVFRNAAKAEAAHEDGHAVF